MTGFWLAIDVVGSCTEVDLTAEDIVVVVTLALAVVVILWWPFTTENE